MPPNSPVGQATVKNEAWKPPPIMDRAAEMLWIVGDQAERPSFDADEGGDHADAKVAADFQHRAFVGEKIDDVANIIDPQAVFRDRPPQQPLVRRFPVGLRALKIRQ